MALTPPRQNPAPVVAPVVDDGDEWDFEDSFTDEPPPTAIPPPPPEIPPPTPPPPPPASQSPSNNQDMIHLPETTEDETEDKSMVDA